MNDIRFRRKELNYLICSSCSSSLYRMGQSSVVLMRLSRVTIETIAWYDGWKNPITQLVVVLWALHCK